MTVVDVHCHLVPGDVAELVEPLPGISLGRGSISVGGAAFPFPDGLLHPEACWARFSGTFIVSPPPSLFLYGLPADRSAEFARRLNDGLIALVETFPTARYLAWLPLQAPHAAIAEVRRVASAERVVGVAIGSSQRLTAPELDELWDEVGALGLAAFLHPNGDPFAPGAPQAPRRASTIGFPAATALTVSDLLLSGSRFWDAGVHLCLAHGGGALPVVAERVARAAEPAAGERLRERMPRLWADGVVFGEPQRRLVTETFGRERVLGGTDWPYPLSIGAEEQQWLGVGGDRAAAGWAPRLAGSPD